MFEFAVEEDHFFYIKYIKILLFSIPLCCVVSYKI